MSGCRSRGWLPARKVVPKTCPVYPRALRPSRCGVGLSGVTRGPSVPDPPELRLEVTAFETTEPPRTASTRDGGWEGRTRYSKQPPRLSPRVSADPVGTHDARRDHAEFVTCHRK